MGVSVTQMINGALYSRKHKPVEWYNPEVKQIANRLGVNYNKPIYVTDNPSVRNAFTNVITNKITLPMFYKDKYDSSEVNGILSHELAHIKNRRIFVLEMLGVIGLVAVFTLLLVLLTIPVTHMVAGFAIAMLLTSHYSRKNEFRADRDGSLAYRPEPLISVFVQMKSESKKDEGSETHPPFHERIDRLMKLLESDI